MAVDPVVCRAVIKIPIAGLMLWMPFRYDESMRTTDAPDSSEEDGGSMALPGGPLDPHPRGPRRAAPTRSARLPVAALAAAGAHGRAQRPPCAGTR